MKNIKYIIISRRMLAAYLLGVFMLIIGGWDFLSGLLLQNRYSGSFLEIFLISLCDGTSSFMIIFFPILGAIPGASVYRIERDSGFQQYRVLKENRRSYRKNKIVSAFCGGFLAVSLACLTWLEFCVLFLNDGNTTFPMIYATFWAEEIYHKFPFIYGLIYALNAGIQTGVFAVVTLGVSAVVKNRYIAFLIPFTYCIFSAAVLESFSSAWNAITLLAPTQYRGNAVGHWGILIYDVILLSIGIFLFYAGDRYAERL